MSPSPDETSTDPSPVGVAVGALFFLVALVISLVVERALFGGDLFLELAATGVLVGVVFGLLIHLLTRD